MKRCPRCEESKPATLEFFYKSNRRHDGGLKTYCKECEKKVSKAYASKNPQVRIDWRNGLRKGISRKKPRKACRNCGVACKTLEQIYCSRRCSQERVFQDNMLVFQFGGMPFVEGSALRRALLRHFGHSCQECKLQEWRGQKMPLEVDHINGDPSDHRLANLRLLCPNCHALTPNHKGRNKGNGRELRQKRRHEERVARLRAIREAQGLDESQG